MGSQKRAALFEMGTWILRFPGHLDGTGLELGEEVQGELPRGHPCPQCPPVGKAYVWVMCGI